MRRRFTLLPHQQFSKLTYLQQRPISLSANMVQQQRSRHYAEQLTQQSEFMSGCLEVPQTSYVFQHAVSEPRTVLNESGCAW